MSERIRLLTCNCPYVCAVWRSLSFLFNTFYCSYSETRKYMSVRFRSWHRAQREPGTGCEELRIGTRDLQKDRRPVYQLIRFSLIRRTWSSGHCCRSTKLDRHAASPYHLYPWQLANMWYLLCMPIITSQSYRIVSYQVGELCRLCMVLSDTVRIKALEHWTLHLQYVSQWYRIKGLEH